MPSLKTFFEDLEKTYPRETHNIAGYIQQGTFKYHISSNENLPAAVVVFDKVGKKQGLVYTNIKKSHWIYTYTGDSGEGDKTLEYSGESNATASEKDTMGAGKGEVRLYAGEGRNPGPLGNAGGLFEAAKALHDSETPVKYGKTDPHTRTRGLHRALRFYMLAAYALLGKCAEGDYGGGNYIAALLVDDKGKIVSYGVNSGWFHHGETNMLLNYFRAHAADGKFPSNTIVFSTLTPCKQCSKYLQSTRPDDSVIFIGQEDTGSRGSEGEKFGVHLGAVTDPLRNRVATPVFREKLVGEKTIPGAWGKPPSKVPIYEKEKTGEKVEKYLLETYLAQKMGQGASVAEQVGQKCSGILIQSRQTFDHKSSKVRDQTHDDELVKHQVLEYLNRWLGGVGSASAMKRIS